MTSWGSKKKTQKLLERSSQEAVKELLLVRTDEEKFGWLH